MKNITITIISILLLGSCSTTVEILPGLCYENRTGTTLCGPEIKPDEFPPQKPIDDIWEMCKPFLDHPTPAWSDCILIA
jgi:hypothetical protein